ncbi:MAG: hypothetical protein HGA81_10855, partial [Chlorobium limicola]|nr:hypothetical protein [Chlorobium limicola]
GFPAHLHTECNGNGTRQETAEEPEIPVISSEERLELEAAVARVKENREQPET